MDAQSPPPVAAPAGQITPPGQTGPPEQPFEPAGPIKAALLSLVCPGLGEIKVGYRRWGAGLLAVFLLCAVWLMAAVYQAANAVKAEIFSADARFRNVPADLKEMSDLQGELFTKMLGKAPAITQRVSLPFQLTVWIYGLSVVEAPIMAIAVKRASIGAPS